MPTDNTRALYQNKDDKLDISVSHYHTYHTIVVFTGIVQSPELQTMIKLMGLSDH